MTLIFDSIRSDIGLPFYGRSFKFATKLNQAHGGSDVANWPDDDGTPQYFNIYNKLPNMIQVRDNKSKTQYAYVSHSTQADSTVAQSLPEGLVSFDDERAICDKVNYVQENGLGGFLVWELCKSLFMKILSHCIIGYSCSPHALQLHSRRCTIGSADSTLGYHKQETWRSIF